MPRVLVIHGAGMNMRGKAQIETFGPMTLAEYDQHIRQYATELKAEVEIFHSNVEGEIINKFYAAHDGGMRRLSTRRATQRATQPWPPPSGR
jgi:3-dehydroquinate dehydratase II